MRCRKIGVATAFTSSMSGLNLPFSAALTLAPTTKYCEARRSGTPGEVGVHRIRGTLAPGACFAGETDRVFQHVVRNGHAPNQLLEEQDFLARDDRIDFSYSIRCGGLDNAQLLLIRWVIHPGVEHESIELRFGKGVGAFLFNRVLGREHEKRSRQGVGLTGDGHGTLLHRLEQCRLCFGRRSVDLIGEDDVGKQRSLHEFEVPCFVENFRPHDIGWHEVGCKLNAVEAQAQGLSDGVDKQRLCESWHPDEQHVATGKYRGGDFSNDVLLSDNDLADFCQQGLVLSIQCLQGFLIRSVHGWSCRLFTMSSPRFAATRKDTSRMQVWTPSGSTYPFLGVNFWEEKT